MKSFKAFLYEGFEGVYTEITKDDLINYIDIINFQNENIVPIYRGARYNLGKYILGNGNYLTRQSVTNSIYHVLISQHLPKWKKYPRRDKSFICTLSYNIASSFGTDVYRVFPLENQKVGICHQEDIWFGFTEDTNVNVKYTHAKNINTAFNTISKIMEKYVGFEKNKSYDLNYVLTKINELSEIIKQDVEKFFEKNYDILDSSFFQKMTEPNIELIDIIEEMLDDKYFDLKNVNDMKKESFLVFPRNEVWMSGKVLFIKKES